MYGRGMNMGNILERFHSSLASSRLGSPGATTGTENGPFYSQRTCLGLPVLSNTTCWTRYVQKRVGSLVITVQKRHCCRSPFGRAVHGLEMVPSGRAI